MSQQRFTALAALGGTLFLIGSVAVLAGLVIPDGSAPIEAATPQTIASTKGDRDAVAFSNRFSDWASVGAALPESRMPSSVAIAPGKPDPVQDVVEAVAPPVELAAIDSAAVPETQTPPPAAPPEAIATAAKPDPAQDVVETAAPPVELAAAASVDAAVSAPQSLPPATFTLASAPDPVQDDLEAAASPLETAAIASLDPAESDPRPPVRLVSLFRPAEPTEGLKRAVRRVETPNECLVVEICVDDYLWSFYEVTPKVDTNKVTHRVKTTIRKKGKTRVVNRTVVKYVLADFTWKDPIAAERAGMPLKDYVIGGMDRRFKLKLYHAFRAMDDAGLMPGITSAFRDDYRQGIASGKKAASDSSYHGGSRRGGYGHGLAADIVSVKGETRMERWASTVELWKWLDVHEKELGIGRPYLGRDPPHVAPIDGKEFADKRGGAKGKRIGSAPGKRRPVAGGSDPGAKPAATKPAPVRVGSIRPASS
jgi:hypothetical protein